MKTPQQTFTVHYLYEGQWYYIKSVKKGHEYYSLDDDILLTKDKIYNVE